MLEAFGRGLRCLRESEGLTLEEMSKRSGLSRRHLIEIEQGKVNVRLLTLVRLAEVLERDVPTMWEEAFQTRISSKERRLGKLLGLLRRRAHHGLVEVNIPSYAQELGVSKSTIKRYLRELERRGRLQMHRRRTGRGNGAIYRVIS